jgi:serine/threonine kinase 16
LFQNIVDDAAQHTTMPYRPPELFEGGVRAGDADLDYRKVDVWALGCTLFAILYGASPSEAEFRHAHGRLRVVECTHLKVIGPVPRPPSGSDAANWYNTNIQRLIEYILVQDRHKRPALTDVMERVEQLIVDLGGTVEAQSHSRRSKNYQDDASDDGLSLISTNRLV